MHISERKHTYAQIFIMEGVRRGEGIRTAGYIWACFALRCSSRFLLFFFPPLALFSLFLFVTLFLHATALIHRYPCGLDSIH